MRRILLFSAILCLGYATMAQSPSKFNYQAVARDAGGELIADKTIAVKVSILIGSATGTAAYSEEHAPTTNAFGLFNFKIGEGTNGTGSLGGVDWGTNTHFISVEVDPEGGTNYTISSTSELVSVPYAMNAKTVENDAVDDADADPTNEIQTLSLTGNSLDLSIGGGSVDLSAYDQSTALAAEVAARQADSASFQGQIDDNTTDIGTNATDIATNATDIATNTTDISTNATDIATNATDIATNATDIATNATDIAANADSIDQVAANLATHVAADMDVDSTNELITGAAFVNDSSLVIYEAGDSFIVDLSSLINDDDWVRSGDTLSNSADSLLSIGASGPNNVSYKLSLSPGQNLGGLSIRTDYSSSDDWAIYNMDNYHQGTIRGMLNYFYDGTSGSTGLENLSYYMNSTSYGVRNNMYYNTGTDYGVYNNIYDPSGYAYGIYNQISYGYYGYGTYNNVSYSDYNGYGNYSNVYSPGSNGYGAYNQVQYAGSYGYGTYNYVYDPSGNAYGSYNRTYYGSYGYGSYNQAYYPDYYGFGSYNETDASNGYAQYGSYSDAYNGSTGTSYGSYNQGRSYGNGYGSYNYGYSYDNTSGYSAYGSYNYGYKGGTYYGTAYGSYNYAYAGASYYDYAYGSYNYAGGGYYGNYATYSNGVTYSSGGFTSSDRKLKKNIRDYEGAIGDLMQLKPRVYDFDLESYPTMGLPEEEQLGLVAQELEAVFPNLIKETHNPKIRMPETQAKEAGFKYVVIEPAMYDEEGNLTQDAMVDAGDEVDFKAVNYTALIPVLIKGIQEQQALIEALETRIEQLEAE